MGFYRQALIPHLPADLFELNPGRLVWWTCFAAIACGSYLAIVHLNLHWTAKLALGVAIGISNGVLTFVCHEVGHGSVVKSKKLQDFLIIFGTMPFFISPTFWRFWHNKMHHGRTQQVIWDPDAFPKLRIFKGSRFVQNIFPFTPGSGYLRSYAYFFYWFSFHNFVAQTYLRFRNSVFESMDHRRVSIEFGFQCLLAISLLAWAGPSNWLWVLLVPILAQNYFVMSYISTNHNLSPLTKHNDPLENSLSVTNHPAFEFISLNFGYHVEHHIFPTVSGKHMKKVHKKLVELFPNDYQVMPKWKAMKALYSTPRIYRSDYELIHPETQAVAPTLGTPPMKWPSQSKPLEENLGDFHLASSASTLSEITTQA